MKSDPPISPALAAAVTRMYEVLERIEAHLSLNLRVTPDNINTEQQLAAVREALEDFLLADVKEEPQCRNPGEQDPRDALVAMFNSGRLVLHPDTPRDVRETIWALLRRAHRAIDKTKAEARV
jgi:hypothetical protein